MTNQPGKQVAIIGAGASGLMAADHLSALRPDLSITLYDGMPSPARKILMAGKSGLNITHKQGIDDPAGFAARYGTAEKWIAPLLADFGAAEIIDWITQLGADPFVGSSGRIFPKVMKASPLLRALMKRLEARGVTLKARHRWMGWDETGQLSFNTPDGTTPITADATLLALGGPSWPRLGTDGGFLPVLGDRGLTVHPFKPANCGFDIDWQEDFGKEWAGTPIKSVALRHGEHVATGDFVITRTGIEGGTVYALSAPLRERIATHGSATLFVDLRPNQSAEALANRLSRPRGKQSMANHVRKSINLKGPQAALLKHATDRDVMRDPTALAAAIKALPLTLARTRPISEAISCAGGVDCSQVNEQMMVKRIPGLFLAGEMLDWEAPTGGYLLTACLSQGHRAAEGLASYLGG